MRVSRQGPDADRLDVLTGASGAREVPSGSRVDASLRIRYPADRVLYREVSGRTTLRVRDDGTFGGREGRRVVVSNRGNGLEAHADLEVRVPAGKTLLLDLGVGRATVSNVEGDLVLNTHAGSVATRGTRGRLEVDTGSGRVTLLVPESFGARLEVQTGSGGVEVDVPVRIERSSRSGLTGSVGDGRGRVTIDTGSGRVRIVRRSDVASGR